MVCFFFSSRRRHTRYWRDWSSDVCSSDLRPASLRPGSQSARTTTRYAVLPPPASGSPPRSRTLTHPSQLRIRSGATCALASVPVLETYDVVEVRRRDLEDGRVLERRDPVHGARPVPEGRAGGDDLLAQRLLPRIAELEPRPAALDVPALVLLPVELERERLARPHKEDLPDVRLGIRPDQLPAPRLLHPTRLEGEAVEGTVVRRVDAHASCLCGFQSGCASMNSVARRRSFGVFTVSQTPSWRYACNRRSSASRGKVDCSWSPFSGRSSSASPPRT